MTAVMPQAAPRDLIPGHPESVDNLAALLEGYAHGTADGAARLRGLDQGPWTGPGAEAFRTRLATLPARLETGAEVFGNASGPVRLYAAVLREAQAKAAQAIALAREAQRESAHYQRQVEAHQQAVAAGDPTVPAPPPVDPGAETQAQAQRMVDEARGRVDQAAAYAANVLRAGAERAPNEPGFWHHLWWGAKQFGLGFKESVVGTFTFLYHLSPTYARLHPVKASRFYRRLGDSFVYGVQHPVEFGKAMIDWETWKENPARALGHLGPDTILAAATGGAGFAAKGGLRGMRSLKRLNDDGNDGDNGGDSDDGDNDDQDPTGEPIRPSDLSQSQQANYHRYEKKLPTKASEPTVEQLADGNVRFTAHVPASEVPGSYAEYVKVADSEGQTVSYLKRTYAPDGSLIHTKVKYP